MPTSSRQTFGRGAATKTPPRAKAAKPAKADAAKANAGKPVKAAAPKPATASKGGKARANGGASQAQARAAAARTSAAATQKGSKRDPLATYRAKRDFTKTNEPTPQVAAGEGWQFCVQKHDATRLHYDLRLELDGVLKSWAVTRGPSLVPGEKRLAVQTEDHPMKYLEFEGVIPKGEYGAGTMIVWDRGTWAPVGDPRKGLKKGHIDIELAGQRLQGRWHLVRMRQRPNEKKEQWLMIKATDEHARSPDKPDLLEEEQTSLLSGRSNADLEREGDVREDHAARAAVARTRSAKLPDVAKVRGAKKAILPDFVEPSLATLAPRAPTHGSWLHEIKQDGYRTQARIDGKSVKMLSRKGLDWTDRFTPIADTLKTLKLSAALLDGEIVVEDQRGVSSFNLLQGDLKDGRTDRLRYYAFDLLYYEGKDLRGAPLRERKALLHDVLSRLPADSNVRFSEHLAENGQAMLEGACRLGLEGIISKRADDPYRSGRSESWLKVKCVEGEEFVVVGYSPSEAVPGSIGSLILGYFDGGKLIYAGRVGTGFKADEARTLRKTLEVINAPKPKFANKLPAGADKGVRWAEPKLVAEIEFRGWSKDGVLRQASYKGIREDKTPDEVGRDIKATRTMAKPSKSKEPARAAAPGEAIDFEGVRLSNPDRVLWAEQGVTKLGLAEFYADIADWVLPHVTHRVLSLVRCPTGQSAHCFYAKHAWAGADASLRPIEVGDGEPMLFIEDLRGLIALVQAGTLEIHPWGSKTDDIEKPDRLIIDLDPGPGVDWPAIIEAAKEVKQRLADLKLKSFVKISGGKGLHVVFPIDPVHDWDTAKAFTKRIADEMAADSPDRFVSNMAKKIRTGKIFVDYLRNGRGQTAVAAYSTRARPGAPVSVPIEWSELAVDLRPDHFRMDNLRQRLDYLRKDPWREIDKVRQRLPAEAKAPAKRGGKR